MKLSPITGALIYFAMGILFSYMALQTADETVWNLPTVLLMLFATFQFGVSIRLIAIYIRLKKEGHDNDQK